MSIGELVFWCGLMLLGFFGSAMYSGLETGSYCMNRVRLHVRATRGDKRAIRVERMINQPTTLLSTLLIGNNIMNYLGTASVAVILSRSGLNETQQIVLNTVMVTPLLFVFGETLPKDLFSVHADGLMYRLEKVLHGSKWVFTVTLLVPIVAMFSSGVMRAMRQGGAGAAFHPRRRIGDLVKEGVGSGLLSDEQSQMVERVLGSASLTIASQMTPWRQSTPIDAGAGGDRVRQVVEAGGGPLPPGGGGGGRGVGVVGGAACVALRQGRTRAGSGRVRPALSGRGGETIRRALAGMRRRDVWLVVVTDAQDQPLGTATLYDLLRPVTGPLPE